MLICGVLSVGFLSDPFLKTWSQSDQIEILLNSCQILEVRTKSVHWFCKQCTDSWFLDQTWLRFIMLIMSTGAPESWSDPGPGVGVRRLPSSLHREQGEKASPETDSQTLLLDHPSAGFTSVFPPPDLRDLSAHSRPPSSCIEVTSS